MHSNLQYLAKINPFLSIRVASKQICRTDSTPEAKNRWKIVLNPQAKSEFKVKNAHKGNQEHSCINVSLNILNK